MKKACLFCGSDLFDSQNTCILCHRSQVDGRADGNVVSGVVPRKLKVCQSRGQFVLTLLSGIFTVLLSFLLFLSHFNERFLFINLPDLYNSVWLAIGMFLVGGALLFYAFYRLRIEKNAQKAVELIDQHAASGTMDLSESMKHYYTYEALKNGFFWLLLIVPLVVFPLIIAFVYYASSYDYMIVFGTIRVILPDMDHCLAFKLFFCLLAAASFILCTIDLFISMATCLGGYLDIRKARKANDEQYRALLAATKGDSVSDESAEVKETVTITEEMIRSSDDALIELKLLDTTAGDATEVYEEALNWQMLCIRLNLCLLHQGLELPRESLLSLISAISSYRMISLQGDKDEVTSVLKALSECFGYDMSEMSMPTGIVDPSDLLYRATENGRRATEMLKTVYKATHEKNAFRAVFLRLPTLSDVPGTMTAFLNYSKNPHSKHRLMLADTYVEALPEKVDAGEDKTVYLTIPQNIWCFVNEENTADTHTPLTCLNEGSMVTVAVEGHRTEGVAKADIELLPINYRRFHEMVKDVTQVAFLAEEQWKKFDKLQAFLKERCGYRFDNRLMRKLEVYTGVYLACGGDANQAIDSVLESVLSSILAETDRTVWETSEGKIGIGEMMDRIFGSDNIPGCHRLLSKLRLNA